MTIHDLCSRIMHTIVVIVEIHMLTLRYAFIISHSDYLIHNFNISFFVIYLLFIYLINSFDSISNIWLKEKKRFVLPNLSSILFLVTAKQSCRCHAAVLGWQEGFTAYRGSRRSLWPVQNGGKCRRIYTLLFRCAGSGRRKGAFSHVFMAFNYIN